MCNEQHQLLKYQIRPFRILGERKKEKFTVRTWKCPRNTTWLWQAQIRYSKFRGHRKKQGLMFQNLPEGERFQDAGPVENEKVQNRKG